MTEYITKGQAVDAAYRAIHYGFNDVHKAMMEGKDLKVNADNFYYTLLENVRAEIAVALPDDVVEVVRCKDCAYSDPDCLCSGEVMYKCGYNSDPCLLLNGNHFCSNGRKLKDGKNND